MRGIFPKRESNPDPSNAILEIHSVSHRFFVVAAPDRRIYGERFNTASVAMVKVEASLLSDLIEDREKSAVVIGGFEGDLVSRNSPVAFWLNNWRASEGEQR